MHVCLHICGHTPPAFRPLRPHLHARLCDRPLFEVPLLDGHHQIGLLRVPQCAAGRGRGGGGDAGSRCQAGQGSGPGFTAGRVCVCGGGGAAGHSAGPSPQMLPGAAWPVQCAHTGRPRVSARSMHGHGPSCACTTHPTTLPTHRLNVICHITYVSTLLCMCTPGRCAASSACRTELTGMPPSAPPKPASKAHPAKACQQGGRRAHAWRHRPPPPARPPTCARRLFPL